MIKNPKSFNAQAACSLDEPQPKLSPEMSMLAPLYSGLFKLKSGLSDPSSK